MSRSTQNSIPVEYWGRRPGRDAYQPVMRNYQRSRQSNFPPYQPASDAPNHIEEVADPWWSFQEIHASRPIGIVSFAAPQYFPDQTTFMTRNTYPRQRQSLPDVSSSFQGRWNMQSTPLEESKLSQDEQKKVLNKLKREIYHPTPKRLAEKPNLYYREFDINNYKERLNDKDEDGKRCAICLEDFEPKEVVSVTPCKHMFHEDCIIPWVKSQGQCPVCRFAICNL